MLHKRSYEIVYTPRRGHGALHLGLPEGVLRNPDRRGSGIRPLIPIMNRARRYFTISLP
jgi:hypothetical protein